MLHVVAAATIRATSTGLARAVTTTTAAVFTGSFDGFFRAEVVTLVDPNLNTHDTVGRVGFARGIVDVGTKRLQRHTAFAVPLVTGDVSAVKTARRLHLDAEGTETHGVLHSTLHGAAEHHALFKLLRDARQR